MDPAIVTPRLKMTLVTKLEPGSPELDWFHQITSDEKATWWSIHGRAKTIEDTERIVKNNLPTGQGGSYRVMYAVHKILTPISGNDHIPDNFQTRLEAADNIKTEFIGFINLRSLESGGLPLPEDLTLPASAASTTLTIEVAYMLLPAVWGVGYATESVNAVFEACQRARQFWMPYEKLYVRALVNEGNPPSQRVMEKTGMVKKGVYEWKGKAIFLAGKWRETDRLWIYGKHLL